MYITIVISQMGTKDKEKENLIYFWLPFCNQMVVCKLQPKYIIQQKKQRNKLVLKGPFWSWYWAHFQTNRGPVQSQKFPEPKDHRPGPPKTSPNRFVVVLD